MATTTAKKPAAPPQSRRNRDKETLYRPGSLHKWFAFTSTLLVIAWIWMIWKDYDREWKDYQKAFFQTQLAMAKAEKKELSRETADRHEEIHPLRRRVQQEWAALQRNPKYAAAVESRDALKRDVEAADKAMKGAKGILAPYRFQYEKARETYNAMKLARANGNKYKGYDVSQSDVDSAEQSMKDMELVVDRAGDELFDAEGAFRIAADKFQSKKAEVIALESAWSAAKAELEELERPQAMAEKKLEGLELLYDKNQWRNWPFLDFISPSIKVRQVVVDEVHDNWNFDTNVKVDRCITCHLGIDLPTWGDAETLDRFDVKPYMQAHPGLDLISGKSSPHPVERFGCSVCHHGVGWSTDFSRAAHTEPNAIAKARWKEEHGYYKAKYIDFPMIPTKHVQGQCFKCHKEGMAWPVAYKETLDHGFLQGKDEITGEELGQRRYHGEDPPAGSDNRMLGWHEVYGDCCLPKAPKPVAGSAADVAAEQWFALVDHYADAFPDDPDVIERFATKTVADYGWEAKRYDRGYDTAVRYGCQGCHKVRDFGDQVGYEEPPRVGPTLTYIADKVKPEWLDKWIKYPEMYRVDTKMPSFFWFTDKDREWNYRLDENGKRKAIPVTDAHMIYPDLAEKLGTNTTQAENDLANLQVLAMKTYLLNQRNGKTGRLFTRKDPSAPDYDPYYEEKLPPGDETRGRDLVASLGCMACHIVPEVEQNGEWVADGPERFDFDPQKMAGPRITSLGSKISDPGWLNAWLVNPRHYTSTTRMPDMRITDVVDPATGEVLATAEQQRADIIAYLLKFKDEEFDALPNVAFNRRWEPLLRDLYENYFGKTSDGDWVRRSTLAEQVSVADPVNLATTLARVGERLMGRNGCFGCHEVDGHELDQPIGTELSNEGTKNLHMLDFGAVPKEVVYHTRQNFFFHKLRTPRIWDWAKVKIWQDRLRMPRFNFRVDPTPEELAAVKAEDEAVYAEEVAEAKKAREAGEDYEWPEKPLEHISTREAVVAMVLGWVDEPIQDAAIYRPNNYQKDLIDGRRVIKRYACNNCHTIEGLQGLLWGYFVDPPRDENDEPVFAPVDPATMPPNLFTQGLRTRTEWLVKFLKNPKYLRPIVNVHMPRFGLSDAEATALARYFIRLAGADQQLIIPRPDSILTKEGQPNYVAEAKELFETINCNKCHLPKGTPGADPKDGGVAPSFSHSSERLRYGWVHALLHDPGRLISGTKMPQVFPTPRGYGRNTDEPNRKYLFWLREDPAWNALNNSDDPEKKIEALKQLAEVQMEVLTDYLLWHYRPVEEGN